LDVNCIFADLFFDFTTVKKTSKTQIEKKFVSKTSKISKTDKSLQTALARYNIVSQNLNRKIVELKFQIIFLK
jgi:hypothetical protein